MKAKKFTIKHLQIELTMDLAIWFLPIAISIGIRHFAIGILCFEIELDCTEPRW